MCTSKQFLGSLHRITADPGFYWSVQKLIRRVSWLFWLQNIRNCGKKNPPFGYEGKGWVILTKTHSRESSKALYLTLRLMLLNIFRRDPRRNTLSFSSHNFLSFFLLNLSLNYFTFAKAINDPNSTRGSWF